MSAEDLIFFTVVADQLLSWELYSQGCGGTRTAGAHWEMVVAACIEQA
jgi:hypothetical protein